MALNNVTDRCPGLINVDAPYFPLSGRRHRCDPQRLIGGERLHHRRRRLDRPERPAVQRINPRPQPIKPIAARLLSARLLSALRAVVIPAQPILRKPWRRLRQPRPQLTAVRNHPPLPIDHPQPRIQPPLQPLKNERRLARIDRPPIPQRRRQNAPLLHHRHFERRQQLPLVNVEIQNSRSRQEHQQQVESQQPIRDARAEPPHLTTKAANARRKTAKQRHGSEAGPKVPNEGYYGDFSNPAGSTWPRCGSTLLSLGTRWPWRLRDRDCFVAYAPRSDISGWSFAQRRPRTLASR